MTTIGRIGWENENLARFILSKISFVAQPVSVSDDVGTDFFCTLFKIIGSKGQLRASPTNSFSIQIKSNRDSIPATEKRAYLNRLELPYFIGVVAQAELSLDIYSGEYLPVFFPAGGVPDRMRLYLVDAVNSISDYVQRRAGRVVGVRCPYVTSMRADSSSKEFDEARDRLSDACTATHRNLSVRHSGESLYDFPRVGQKQMLAGSGSVRVFRRNFLNRLAECIHNLYWLMLNRPTWTVLEESLFYLDFCEQLAERGVELPGLLITQREVLCEQVEEFLSSK